MFDELSAAVVAGEPPDVETLTKEALEEGVDPLQYCAEGLTKGIKKVEELSASGEYFLPKLIIGADAMKATLDILEPALVGGQTHEVVGTVVLGTIEGDLHEIGKTLVGTMLTANGFKVIDIGADGYVEDAISAVDMSFRLVDALVEQTTSK
jgi:methanogenic corrinoid protein MtbC1